ncbi:MAG: pyridoxamine 5'-phosphate oxidase family protein [Planctomycetaceae bacterium]
MRWDAFEEACPEIATIARERFATDEVVMLGTLRPDGLPRLSPNEVDFAEGRLCLGMMPNSLKALDLRRDPRLLVHSVPQGRMNPGGDIKLRGLAIEETDLGLREAYRRTILERIGWAPDEPDFHLFTLDVRDAVFMRFGEEPVAQRWDETIGLRRIRHPDDPS